MSTLITQQVFFDANGRLSDEISIASLDLRSKIDLLSQNNRALPLNDQCLRDRRENVALLETALNFAPPVAEAAPVEKTRPRGMRAVPGSQTKMNAPDHLPGDMWRIDRSRDVDGDERYFHDSFWTYSAAEFQGASSHLRKVSSRFEKLLVLYIALMAE